MVEVRFTLGTLFRICMTVSPSLMTSYDSGPRWDLHNRLNAATRGWNVDDHDALRFFEIAWKGEANGAQGGKPA